jgi:hypothetical protein
MFGIVYFLQLACQQQRSREYKFEREQTRHYSNRRARAGILVYT